MSEIAFGADFESRRNRLGLLKDYDKVDEGYLDGCDYLGWFFV